MSQAPVAIEARRSVRRARRRPREDWRDRATLLHGSCWAVGRTRTCGTGATTCQPTRSVEAAEDGDDGSSVEPRLEHTMAASFCTERSAMLQRSTMIRSHWMASLRRTTPEAASFDEEEAVAADGGEAASSALVVPQQ